MQPAKRNCGCLKKYGKVTHCLFDMDGTLLDSEEIYHVVIAEILKEFGKDYTEELKQKIYGGTDKDMSIACVREAELPISVEEFQQRMTDGVDKNIPNSLELPGAARLLNHLYENNIPFCMVTNSTREAVELHSKAKPHIFAHFSHIVAATDPDVKAGKPAPDMYLLGASKFPNPPDPKRCLAFEDSITGATSGKAAGMQVVMIPMDLNKNKEKMQEVATVIIKSLLDFRPELFGLPPFKDRARG